MKASQTLMEAIEKYSDKSDQLCFETGALNFLNFIMSKIPEQTGYNRKVIQDFVFMCMDRYFPPTPATEVQLKEKNREEFTSNNL